MHLVFAGLEYTEQRLGVSHTRGFYPGGKLSERRLTTPSLLTYDHHPVSLKKVNHRLVLVKEALLKTR